MKEKRNLEKVEEEPKVTFSNDAAALQLIRGTVVTSLYPASPACSSPTCCALTSTALLHQINFYSAPKILFNDNFTFCLSLFLVSIDLSWLSPKNSDGPQIPLSESYKVVENASEFGSRSCTFFFSFFFLLHSLSSGSPDSTSHVKIPTT